MKKLLIVLMMAGLAWAPVVIAGEATPCGKNPAECTAKDKAECPNKEDCPAAKCGDKSKGDCPKSKDQCPKSKDAKKECPGGKGKCPGSKAGQPAGK